MRISGASSDAGRSAIRRRAASGIPGGGGDCDAEAGGSFGKIGGGMMRVAGNRDRGKRSGQRGERGEQAVASLLDEHAEDEVDGLALRDLARARR